MKKIGELKSASIHFVLYCDGTEVFKYKLYKKWYDITWHRTLIDKFYSLSGCTDWIATYIRRNEEGR